MKKPKQTTPMTLLDVIKNGYFQQVRYLVDNGANVDQRDEERRTPLMLCAFIEPEEWGVGICRLLIETGATLDRRDKYGLSAFHYAVIYERVELVRVYLKAIDFDLKAGDKHGNTALHYAVRSGNTTIVRLIVQMYVKYKINLEKENNEGLTALQEAYRQDKRRCARILETTDTLADCNGVEANLPLDLKSTCETDENVSVKSSRRTLSRPRSSILSRRSSKSSVATTSDYYYRRSPTIFSYDTSHRYPTKRETTSSEIRPNEKNVKNLIRCASLSDFRNNPEYLFHMTPLVSAGSMDIPQSTPKRNIRAKSAFVRRSEVENDDRPPRSSWRTEFRRLYAHFQYQCTPSYRDTVTCEIEPILPVLDKPMTPANSEHGLDEVDKSKKSKMKPPPAPTKPTADESLNNAAKGRPQSKSSTRGKVAQNVGHGTKMVAADGSLESSNESINSSASSKKQPDGKISKPVKDPAGRTTRTSGHKVPSLTVDEAMSTGQGSDGSDVPAQDSGKLHVIDE